MSYSVIVAEDETLLLENLCKKINLSNTGFKVAGSAPTGIQALKLVEESNADLLITDIRMPVMDGLTLIKKVRERYPSIDIIITSGFSEFEYAHVALQNQVAEYLLKPIDSEILQKTLLQLKEKYMLEQNTQETIFSQDSLTQTPEQTAELLKEYLIQNYAQDIPLHLIAQNMNYSSSYLTKIFCQYYNCTPSKYLISLRIQKAQHLLAHHVELSIRQIGETVGYPEQGYFSRIFKKQTGVSPLEYRESKQ